MGQRPWRHCYSVHLDMRFRYNLFIILIFTAFLCALSSCSVMKKQTKQEKEPAERIKHDKNIGKEAEKHLKGKVKDLIEEAFTWEGTPYGYGKQTKGEATDCSGFVMLTFDKSIGCKLPRVSREQAEFCKKIKPEHVRAGDLVFFATGKDPERISHVGIMIDDIQFIHASSSKGVCVSSMNSDYYKKHFIMYGRVPCL